MLNQEEHKNTSIATLYIVPTPIGNLGDITFRALSILRHVDIVVAEDTRYSGLLLQYFSISARFFSLHNYNEQKRTNFLLAKLQDGKNIALVSNAGTPLINDPGYHLVQCCRKMGIRVTPLPGACAAITALSASGLPSNRFCYEGFLPAKRKTRLDLLKILAQESRTLIFYESTHRVLESLEDMIIIWGSLRYVVLARELTKSWESIYGAPVGELFNWIQKDNMRRRGEIVLIVEGYRKSVNPLTTEVLRTLSLLLPELSVKKATSLTAEIHGIKKNTLYRYVLNKKKKYQ